MKSVGLKTDAKPTTYTYDEVGNRTATNQGNGVKSEYAFNAKNQLVELKNLNKDGTTIETFTYTYDAAGNQLTKVSSKGTTSYSYDVLNRLTKVVEPSGKTTEYTYDASGNRELERVSSGLVDYELGYYYNDQNRLTKTVKRKPDGSKETINYAYDPNGNQTGKTYESTKKVDPLNPPDASFGLFVYGQTTTNLKLESIIAGTASYEYNKRNELIKTTGKTSTATYKYNGDGYRSEKAVVENGKTATTKYYYEADKVVLELDQNGKFLARNVYGLLLESRVVATPANERLSYTYNGHGDVTALVNEAGVIKGKYDYDAFGNITQLEGTANNSVQYAGYQFDSESGLYYLNARHYDPATARFMQEDTYRGQQSDPLSLNLYTYCHNEPVMYSDPTGHYRKGDEYIKDKKTKDTLKDLGDKWAKKNKELQTAIKNSDEKKMSVLQTQMNSYSSQANALRAVAAVTGKCDTQYYKDNGIVPLSGPAAAQMAGTKASNIITSKINDNNANAGKSTTPSGSKKEDSMLNMASSATASLLSSAASIEKKQNMQYKLEKNKVYVMPSNYKEVVKPLKKMGVIGEIITASALVKDVSDIWNEDVGNSNSKKIGKTTIVVGGAVVSGIGGAVAGTAVGAAVTGATSTWTGPAAFGIGITAGVATDALIDSAVDKGEKVLYEKFQIK